ncbi:MAG: hypothetical protein H7Z73_09060 [Candidatus Saccharibacteria bacterium]|nr:hypothetical protein [Moraxellaceae bacterium]
MTAMVALSCPVYACGPDFPMRLLADRTTTLNEFPESNFDFEAKHFLKPDNKLTVFTGETNYYGTDPETLLNSRNAVEQKSLSPADWALVQRLRTLSSTDVETQGAALPTELRLYLAGATALQHGDQATAQQYFQQVLLLPAQEQKQHALWALYTLGRLHAQQGNDAAAIQSFQQVRARVKAGAIDDLALAVDSFGEEARIYKNQQQWSSAIALYAAQSAQGDASGVASLRMIANQLMTLPTEQLQSLLSDLWVERLLTSWLLSNFSQYGYQSSNSLTPIQQKYYRQVVHVLAQTQHVQPVLAERLAALMYQNADYESASKMLPYAGDGGLAWWVRAKMALREGKLTDARAAYAKAARSFPKNEDWGERRDANYDLELLNPHCRVQGESAILALKQGDYLDAFDQMWQGRAQYWQDAADIAERVLTLDELKTYVDQHVPARKDQNAKDHNHDGKVDEADQYVPLVPEAQLRELLGRRMLRDGRYDGAAVYFRPELKAKAEAYIAARETAASRWHLATTRAEALYRAAEIARQQGLDLLGYENAPDYVIWGGNFGGEEPVKTTDWMGADEVKRQQNSLAQPNIRWHYRNIAAELANQSADFLPARSQAFAAVLCHASGWVADNDASAAQKYYQRYVRQGAYVPWAENFGHTCPAPDFDKARTHAMQYDWYQLKDQLRPHKQIVYLAAFILLFSSLGGGLWIWLRKKKNASST